MTSLERLGYGSEYGAEVDAFRDLAAIHATRILQRHFVGPGLLEGRSIEGVLDALPSRKRSTRTYVRRLIEYFVDRGDLAVHRGVIEIGPRLRARDLSDGQIEAILRRHPGLESAAYFMGRLAEVFSEVLGGSDTFLVLAKRAYAELLRHWESFMLELSIKRPCQAIAVEALTITLEEGRHVVVFEGGAGVGAVLRSALQSPRLLAVHDHLERYVYTDISPTLLEIGRRQIESESPRSTSAWLECSALDLNELASRRGLLAPEGYDLLIFEHVLYDVTDLEATLRELHRALRPGGRLAFTMAFRHRPALFFPCELVQGTFDSYHQARLTALRRHEGYLTAAEWRDLLEDSGFAIQRMIPEERDHERWPWGGIIAQKVIAGGG